MVLSAAAPPRRNRPQPLASVVVRLPSPEPWCFGGAWRELGSTTPRLIVWATRLGLVLVYRCKPPHGVGGVRQRSRASLGAACQHGACFIPPLATTQQQPTTRPAADAHATPIPLPPALCRYDFAASVSIACVQVAMIAKIKVADAACRSAAAAAAAAAAGPVPSTAAGKWPWPLTGLLGRPPPPWLGAWPGDIRCDLIYTNGFRLALCLSVLQLTWLCCAPRAYDQHRMAWALFSRVWKVLYIQVIGAAAARGEAGWEALMASVHSTAAATGSPLHGALSLVFAWSGG